MKKLQTYSHDSGWGSTLIISVKYSTLGNFLFKECFASEQFLENKELIAQFTR